VSYPRTDYIDAQPVEYQLAYYKAINTDLNRALTVATSRWLKAAARVKELEGPVTDAQVEAALNRWLHNDGPSDHDDMRAALEAARDES
jgi:hypothetical protein